MSPRAAVGIVAVCGWCVDAAHTNSSAGSHCILLMVLGRFVVPMTAAVK